MPSIATPVYTEVGDDYRKLAEPYAARFQFRHPQFPEQKACRYKVEVDAGFEWKPSVPVWAWGVVAPHQLMTASLVHDWMYRYRGDLSKEGRLLRYWPEYDCWLREGIVGRKFADDLFLKYMKWTGVPDWRRRIAHVGVRLGGQKKWKSPYVPRENRCADS